MNNIHNIPTLNKVIVSSRTNHRTKDPKTKIKTWNMLWREQRPGNNLIAFHSWRLNFSISGYSALFAQHNEYYLPYKNPLPSFFKHPGSGRKGWGTRLTQFPRRISLGQFGVRSCANSRNRITANWRWQGLLASSPPSRPRQRPPLVSVYVGSSAKCLSRNCEIAIVAFADRFSNRTKVIRCSSTASVHRLAP